MTDRLLGRLLALHIRLVARTSRITYEPADTGARLEAEKPFIYAMWHGQFMMLPALSPRTIPVRVMVARHGDAETLGEALKAFGMDLIRGAGAGARRKDRGGADALRRALRTLEEGHSVAMTAEVPPGPARTVGPGIVALARLSGRPIVPVAAASSRFLAFDTWSRLTVNLPFSRLAVVTGEPIRVARERDAAGLEADRLAVETALAAATRRAYELAQADMARATPYGAAGAGTPPPGLALRLYRTATRLVVPFAGLVLDYRSRRGKEDPARRGERFGIAARSRPDGPLVWLHAASVGETVAVVPVIQGLKERHPETTLLLTTGTVTSARLAAERLAGMAIHQFVPLDAPRFVRRFLDHWRPDLMLLVESEIWPNMVLETTARTIPVALVNGRMSKSSYDKWRKRRTMARALFSRLSLVLAQSEPLARRFSRLGAGEVRAVGNLKADAPPLPIDTDLRGRLKRAIGARPVLLAASTHPGEEALLGAAYPRLLAQNPDLLLVIAPRHPERGPGIAEELRHLGLGVAQRSLGEMPGTRHQAYIADTIGELGTLYSLAPVAFMGGSLVPHGGQNPFEAVKLGAAVLSGPHTHNFKEEYGELMRVGGARLIAGADGLVAAIGELTAEPERLQAMRSAAREAVGNLSGALAKTLGALEEMIERVEAPSRAP
ncbi:MAG: glycosyltransferase N-terminal domain-containing protein [Hyphomicrobiaceae bacterium]